MKQLFILIAALAMINSPALADGHKYTCPMHPQVVSDEPGQCPICGMSLVPVPTKPDDGVGNDLS